MAISNFKKIILFLLISIFSIIIQTSVSFSAEIHYSEDGSVVTSPTPQQQTQPSYKYKTLVSIPGLGDSNGEVAIAPDSLGVYLQVIFNYVIGIAIALAVVMIIWGGVTYATTEAMGGKQAGKTIITDALYGLALALGSYLILNTINPDLLKFDLQLDKITKITGVNGGTGADVSSKLSVVGLQDGVSHVGGGSGQGPSLLAVKGSALANLALAKKIGTEAGLNPILFACQIGRENHFDPGPTSGKGAVGIAQILPATGASICPGTNLLEVEPALRCAAKIMKSNISQYPGSYAQALAAYNGGGAAAAPTTQCASGYAYQCTVDKAGRPVKNNYGETRDYVADISACAQANGTHL
jgi:hypothetical protein